MLSNKQSTQTISVAVDYCNAYQANFQVDPTHQIDYPYPSYEIFGKCKNAYELAPKMLNSEIVRTVEIINWDEGNVFRYEKDIFNMQESICFTQERIVYSEDNCDIVGVTLSITTLFMETENIIHLIELKSFEELAKYLGSLTLDKPYLPKKIIDRENPNEEELLYMINESATDFTLWKSVNDGYYEGYEFEGTYKGDYYSTAKELLKQGSYVGSVCYVDLESDKTHVLFEDKEMQYSIYQVPLRDYPIVSTGSGLLVHVFLRPEHLPDLLTMTQFEQVISYLKSLKRDKQMNIIPESTAEDILPF